jgi:hypothetical protein
LNARLYTSLLLLCALTLFPAIIPAADMEITPFRTTNQSPLVMIHPLPAESSAVISPKGKFSSALTFDLANSYSLSSTATESILLDGESYRWTASTRYGLTDRIEVGIEIPWVLYGGGFLDSFIIDWHDTFGMPQGGRDVAPKNRIHYSYSDAGQQKMLMDSSGSGLGDIVLTGGVKLYEEKSPALHDALALRSTVKLPSGDSDELRGSGAFGGTVSLCGSSNHFTEWGALGLFGSVGGMISAKGDVLKDQQETVAAFGTLGLGWGPAPWISFKVQLNANTPLYKDSSLPELSKSAVMLVTGGALQLPGDYQLDIGVSEDISVATAPDVAFHVGLSRIF